MSVYSMNFVLVMHEVEIFSLWRVSLISAVQGRSLLKIGASKIDAVSDSANDSIRARQVFTLKQAITHLDDYTEKTLFYRSDFSSSCAVGNTFMVPGDFGKYCCKSNDDVCSCCIWVAGISEGTVATTIQGRGLSLKATERGTRLQASSLSAKYSTAHSVCAPCNVRVITQCQIENEARVRDMEVELVVSHCETNQHFQFSLFWGICEWGLLKLEMRCLEIMQ